MIYLLKILHISSILLFADFCVFEAPRSLPINIVIMTMLILAVLANLIMSNKLDDFVNYIKIENKKVIFWAIILLVYIFMRDSIRDNVVDAIINFMACLNVISALAVYEYNPKPFNLFKVLNIIFSISVIFGILQIFGVNHNIGSLIPSIGFIKSQNYINIQTESGTLRISGALFSIIGFSEYLGIFIILNYYYSIITNENIKYKYIRYVYIIILFICLFFTQTRSAIWGLLPTMLLARIMILPNKRKEIIKSIIILVILFGAITIFENIIKVKWHRVFNVNDDISVYSRIQSNYYGIIGTLKSNPIFGVSKEKNLELIENYSFQSDKLIIGETNVASGTSHNQLAYYFRYYGFIGLALILLLYYNIYNKIKATKYIYIKLLFITIILFDLQYNLAHNGKLINNSLVFIILSMAINQTLFGITKKPIGLSNSCQRE